MKASKNASNRHMEVSKIASNRHMITPKMHFMDYLASLSNFSLTLGAFLVRRLIDKS